LTQTAAAQPSVFSGCRKAKLIEDHPHNAVIRSCRDARSDSGAKSVALSNHDLGPTRTAMAVEADGSVDVWGSNTRFGRLKCGSVRA
jgi:hypothetical protein